MLNRTKDYYYARIAILKEKDPVRNDKIIRKLMRKIRNLDAKQQ